MVFSSYEFLFLYLPAFFIAYYLIKTSFWNIHIVLFSLLFYYIGEGDKTVVLIASILLNFICGIGIGAIHDGERVAPERRKTLALAVMLMGVAGNLAILGYFKYVGFFTENIDALLKSLGFASPGIIKVALPLGVSFFAFQGISYLIDVYRRDYKPTYSLMKFAAYKLMFPQLIAGPIVRYSHVAREMDNRTVTVDDAFEGLVRFCRGLAKKVLIADTMGQVADTIFALPHNEIGFGVAWLGVIAYTLQIYFDFSAYSDMAIGLGRMMGFKYPENFNHPYSATSMQDFWRRWHMTLSTWFRDYVYIPLGGNRGSEGRVYLNLLIVFLLTGFWHGAAWTFILWGLWHGAFLMIERRFNPERWRVPEMVRRIYVMAAVMLGWLLFRAVSFEQAAVFLKAMAGLATPSSDRLPVLYYLTPLVAATILVGSAFSLPLRRQLGVWIGDAYATILGLSALTILTAFAVMRVLSGSYSPFLYFRF